MQSFNPYQPLIPHLPAYSPFQVMPREEAMDPIAELQALVHAHNYTLGGLRYEEVEDSGSNDPSRFLVGIRVGGKLIATARGNTKAEASSNAARAAIAHCKTLIRDVPRYHPEAQSTPDVAPPSVEEPATAVERFAQAVEKLQSVAATVAATLAAAQAQVGGVTPEQKRKRDAAESAEAADAVMMAVRDNHEERLAELSAPQAPAEAPPVYDEDDDGVSGEETNE